MGEMTWDTIKIGMWWMLGHLVNKSMCALVPVECEKKSFCKGCTISTHRLQINLEICLRSFGNVKTFWYNFSNGISKTTITKKKSALSAEAYCHKKLKQLSSSYKFSVLLISTAECSTTCIRDCLNQSCRLWSLGHSCKIFTLLISTTTNFNYSICAILLWQSTKEASCYL